jgi:hypothetical protein
MAKGGVEQDIRATNKMVRRVRAGAPPQVDWDSLPPTPEEPYYELDAGEADIRQWVTELFLTAFIVIAGMVVLGFIWGLIYG